ncbi:hypothetical protein JCM6882_000379 [Rhodosporidiobolus microsporus]
MCTAQATIFYGLFVRSFDLLCAVDAWDELEPPFRGVDIINLRRSKNELEVGGNARVRDVSEELWDAIKHELAGLALETAKEDILESVRCINCDATDVRPDDLDQLLDCDDCRDEFTDSGNLENMFNQRRELLHSEVNSTVIMGHEAQHIDPTLFSSIPPSVPGLFRHFVHLFRLEVVSLSAFLSIPTGPDEASHKEASVKSELGWQLWTSSQCCL